MEHFNGFPKYTKVEASTRKDENGYEAKIYWTNSYDSTIGMMLYLVSNTIPDIPFAVHKVCPVYT